MRGATTPSDAAVAAWAGLLKAQRTALALVERRLKEAGLPPLAWYDVLWELERAGACGVRPFALEQALLLAQPNLSRLLDRMEGKGLVTRQRCDADGRGQFVTATASGLSLRRQIWQVYSAAIQEAVGAHLDDDGARRLAELLAPLSRPPGNPATS